MIERDPVSEEVIMRMMRKSPEYLLSNVIMEMSEASVDINGIKIQLSRLNDSADRIGDQLERIGDKLDRLRE